VVVDRAGVEVELPVTVPIVGLMERDVALVTLQLRVEVPFNATTPGEAEKEEMVGRGGDDLNARAEELYAAPPEYPVNVAW
jgi:hypothetical protein